LSAQPDLKTIRESGSNFYDKPPKPPKV